MDGGERIYLERTSLTAFVDFGLGRLQHLSPPDQSHPSLFRPKAFSRPEREREREERELENQFSLFNPAFGGTRCQHAEMTLSLKKKPSLSLLFLTPTVSLSPDFSLSRYPILSLSVYVLSQALFPVCSSLSPSPCLRAADCP